VTYSGFDWLSAAKSAAQALEGRAPVESAKAQQKLEAEKRAAEAKARTLKIVLIGGGAILGLGVLAWFLGGKK
jgi:hypothetical protein